MVDLRLPLLTCAVLLACATTQSGVSEQSLGRARGTVPEGSRLFEQKCAGCHGARGEGGVRAPTILGERGLPEYPRPQSAVGDPATGDPEALRLEARSRPAGAPSRDPFRTAEDLERFVVQNMPPPEDDEPRLSPGEGRSLVHFMLVAHGVAVPPEGVTDQNAKSVKLQVVRP